MGIFNAARDRQESAEIKAVRTIVGRLFPGTELIEGIRSICRQHGIRNGTIVSCVGSLKYASFIWAVPDPLRKMGFRYGEPKVVAGPLEFICAQGTIGPKKGDPDELFVHLHAVFTEDSGNTWSGHVVDAGNPVCATAEVVLLAFDDIRFVRKIDEETDIEIFRLDAK